MSLITASGPKLHGWQPPSIGPSLTPGVWTDITPAVDGFEDTFGVPFIALDRSNSNTIVACFDDKGGRVTYDRGATWGNVGTPETYNFDGTTTWLDSPIRIEINPDDPTHWVATQGVRGNTLGFWVSHNSGALWTIPQGFRDIAAVTTGDVTMLAIDPTDFDHMLVGSHSYWNDGGGDRTAGIMRTQDGGDTWSLIEAPWNVLGSIGIAFLYDAATAQGNTNTWLVTTDGDGAWRTANAGTSFTKVSTHNVPHGGSQVTYDSQGRVWTGGEHYPMYSTNNGVTWTQFTAGMIDYPHYCMVGDGTTLYAQLSYTGTNNGQGLQPFKKTTVAGLESATNHGTQTFINGPYVMYHDAVNDIMYAACWLGGILAMKPVR